MDKNHSARNYGIDLLRIVSMIMVVTLHTLGKGGILNSTQYMSSNYLIAWFLEIAAYCAVDCYALVSGYVGYTSNHKCSNIIYLTFQVIFYVITITAVSCFIFPDIGTKDILASLTHIRSSGYWYYRAYLGAYFFFPLLNMAVDKFDRLQIKKLIIIILVLYSIAPTIIRSDLFRSGDGYSPIWIMILYLTGSYIKKYDSLSVIKKGRCIAIYVTAVTITFITFVVISISTKRLFGTAILENLLIAYTSPTIVLCAISLLAFFSKLQIKDSPKKLIKFLTPLTFGVYLIHMQYFIGEWLTDRFTAVSDSNTVLFILTIFGIILAIYLACTIIEFVRELIFKLLRIKNLSEKIAKLIYMQ